MNYMQSLRSKRQFIPLQRLSIILSLGVLLLCGSCTKKDSSPAETSSTTTTTTDAYWGQVLTFTRDEASKVSAVLDTTAVTLSVTDASGILWTLSIPKQETYIRETITMIPLSNIHSNTDSVKMKGGVLFEPDGLYFAAPATLTAVVPTASSTSTVYVFDHNGAHLWYADVIKNGNSYSTTISHFSGSGLGDDGSITIQEICDRSKLALQSALEEIKTVQQQALNVPVPPSISMDCPSDVNTSAADAYVKQVTNPESDLIAKIISAARNCALACSDAEDFSQTVAKMSPLYSRLDQKANMLLTQYGTAQNADKYFAVGRAVLSIDRNATLVGYRSDALYLTRLSDWALTLRDEYLRRLKEDHDYKAGATVLEIERQAALLGATVNTDETIDKLEKAMMFELVIKANISLPKTSERTGIDYKIEGIVRNIKYTYSDMQWHYDAVEFTMVSGKMDGTDADQKFDGTYLSPATYTADLKFDFKPCDEYAEIVIDRFGPASEVWSITSDNYHDDEPEETNVVPSSESESNAFIMASFFSKINSMPPNPGYLKFTPTITNKNIEAVNQVFNSELPQTFTGNIEFKLTHKPQ